MSFAGLPSLNAFRVFEAAARHGSFVRAADELCVTHGAISRQIRLLEEQLGVTLFERRNRAVFLSREGEALQLACVSALQTLQQAVQQLQPELRQPLTVSCEPTLAMRWLIPRLPQFHVRHPDIEVHLSTAGGAVRLEGGQIELAIRRDDFAIAPHYCKRVLAAEYVGPVCKPAVKSDVRLLTRSRPQAWQDWQRLQPQWPAPTAGSREFEHFYLSLQAAAAGLGVAIASIFMVEDELAGATLAATAGFIADGSSYVLLSLNEPLMDARQQAFASWLQEAMTASIQGQREAGRILVC